MGEKLPLNKVSNTKELVYAEIEALVGTDLVNHIVSGFYRDSFLYMISETGRYYIFHCSEVPSLWGEIERIEGTDNSYCFTYENQEGQVLRIEVEPNLINDKCFFSVDGLIILENNISIGSCFRQVSRFFKETEL